MRAKLLPLAVGFLLLGAADSARAQARPQVSLDDPDIPRPGKIIVRVRSTSGAPITSVAQVRLYSSFIAFNRVQSLGDAGQVTFENVPTGDFIVEVRAPGYRDQTDMVGMYMPGGTNYVHIEMRPDSAGDPTPVAPGPPLLTPRARRELDAAMAALGKNDLTEARAHLERARRLAPNHPDVLYLLGVLALREGQREQARAHLERASSLDPKHTSALVALGGLLMEDRDFVSAVPVLEQAAWLATDAWRPQWLLALAYFEVGRVDEAKTRAEFALAMRGADGAPLRLLLARIYQARGDDERALGQAEAVVNLFPRSPQAERARQLVAALRENARALAATDAGADLRITMDEDLSLPERNWLPPGVDELVPEVSPGVSCPMPDALTSVSRRAHELVTSLERFTASEQVEHAELDRAGLIRWREQRRYEYVAVIRELRRGMLYVEESRDGRFSLGTSSMPIAARGLVALMLLFHPYYVDSLEVRCEGLGRWRGQPAWQIYFQQQQGQQSSFRRLTVGQRSAGVRMKGRAWVAANSFQVLRLETEMMEPLRELNYTHEQLRIEYHPVQFPDRNEQLWLPLYAEQFMQYRGRRYHYRHSFSDYMLFSVDYDDRLQALPTPEPEPDPAAGPPAY